MRVIASERRRMKLAALNDIMIEIYSLSYLKHCFSYSEPRIVQNNRSRFYLKKHGGEYFCSKVIVK